MAGYLIPGLGWWTESANTGQYLVPGAGAIAESGVPTETVGVPVLALTLALPVPGYAPEQVLVPVLALALGLGTPSVGLGFTAPLLVLDLTLNPVAYSAPPRRGRTIYRLVLTGDGEDPPVADLTLPLASFQARRRSGDPSYLSCVVPDPLTYADAIAARPNGDLVVYRGVRFDDGTTQVEEIVRANLEDYTTDRGGRNASLTLIGHKQTTTQAPQRRELTGVSYRHGGSGARRVRCSLDTWLRPGDTAVFPELEDEEFEVALITCQVGARAGGMDEVMEVHEVDAAA